MQCYKNVKVHLQLRVCRGLFLIVCILEVFGLVKSLRNLYLLKIIINKANWVKKTHINYNF